MCAFIYRIILFLPLYPDINLGTDCIEIVLKKKQRLTYDNCSKRDLIELYVDNDRQSGFLGLGPGHQGLIFEMITQTTVIL